jgi:hypothetical protein
MLLRINLFNILTIKHSFACLEVTIRPLTLPCLALPRLASPWHAGREGILNAENNFDGDCGISLITAAAALCNY